MIESPHLVRDRAQFLATALLLVLAVALGGGQGGLGDTLVQIGAVGLLGMLLLSPTARGTLLAMRLPIWIAAGFLALPVLQLLPIPGAAFNGLGAERALWALMPGLAIFLSACTLPPDRQRQLIHVVLAMALIGLVLGLMQVADGPDSALRFYTNTNRSEAVGFFANRNHMAALLVMALPLSIALAVQLFSERLRGGAIGALPIVASAGMAVLIILGVALTRSRAGVVLGMLALILSLPMVLAVRRRQGFKRVFAVSVGLAMLLTAQFALYGILNRFQADPLADLRWKIGAQTVEAARENLPMGAGLGSFRGVYEASDVNAPTDAIINHAHNDYLELWLEAGWPFAVLAGMFAVLVLIVGARAWRTAGGHTTTLWVRAAWISIALALTYSAGDYPLRTTGIQAVFAMLMAMLVSVPRRSKPYWIPPGSRHAVDE